MAERETNFEDAMEKLDKIVERLESEKTGLEEAMKLYEEGARLVKTCEKKLSEAEAKLEKILPGGSDDKPDVGPLKTPES